MALFASGSVFALLVLALAMRAWPAMVRRVRGY